MLNGEKCGGFDVSASRCASGASLQISSFHRGAAAGSAPLVFQHVQRLLVLGLEGHDEVLRGDLAPAVLVHLAREDVVQAW